MKNIENCFYTKKIQIPSQVKIQIENNIITLRGPLGVLELNLKKMDSLCFGFFHVNEKTNELEIYVKKVSKKSKAFFGSLLSFFQNSFHGICQGFLIYLELSGVGFRAILHETINRSTDRKLSSRIDIVDPSIHDLRHSFSNSVVPKYQQEIEFKIGQTHDLFYSIPKNIRVFSIKPTLFCLYGIEKTQITQIAAEIRNLKIPEPYKGKGIKYKDEIVVIKVGKKK
jgi:large subunit ribosomal protein L6